MKNKSLTKFITIATIAVVLLASGFTYANAETNQNNQDGKSVVVKVTLESPGAKCANGGYRIDLYRDMNNNGTYQPNIDKPLLGTAYSCKGATGSQGSQ